MAATPGPDLGAAAGMAAGSASTRRRSSSVKLAADPSVAATDIDAAKVIRQAAEREEATEPAGDSPEHGAVHIRIPEFVAGPDGEPHDFATAPTLRELGEYMIDTFPELSHLKGKPIAYLFKRQGGKSGGVPVWGAATVASGKEKFAFNAVFVVWLAADHCQAAQITDIQFEKLLFHQLLHLGVKVDDRTDAETPTTRPHDVEAFAEELARYGAWTGELMTTRDLLTQSRLDLGEPVSFRGRM